MMGTLNKPAYLLFRLKRACRKTFFEKTQCDTPFLSKKEGKTVGRMEKRRQQPVYGHNKAEEASSPKKNSIWIDQDAFGICK